MRIISGIFKSRKLIAPKGDSTRPTSDRARESLFNVLQNMLDFEDITVLDLFAGSGGFGYEAFSRGAKNAIFVEQDRKACAAIQANAESLGLRSALQIIKKDAYKWLGSTSGEFEIIFADPPYDDIRTLDALPKLIFSSRLLTPNSFVIIEHRTGSSVIVPPEAELIREFGAGEAVFSFLRQKSKDFGAKNTSSDISRDL